MPNDYLMGLIGGLILGLASSGLLFFNGQIFGVSGIMKGAVTFAPGYSWRWALIFGMLSAGTFWNYFFPAAFQINIERSFGICVIAGILIGVGTYIGGGCTSGHGICGVGRFSKRSIVATLVFIASGGLTVYFVRVFFGGVL